MKKIKITSAIMQVDSLVQTLVVGPQQMQTYSLILRPQFSGLPYSLHKKTRCESVCGGQGCTDAGWH